MSIAPERAPPPHRRSLISIVRLVSFINKLRASVRARPKRKVLAATRNQVSQKTLRLSIENILLSSGKIPSVQSPLPVPELYILLPGLQLFVFAYPINRLFHEINIQNRTSNGSISHVAASNKLLCQSTPKRSGKRATIAERTAEIKHAACLLERLQVWIRHTEGQIDDFVTPMSTIAPNSYDLLFLANVEHLLLRHIGHLLNCLHLSIWTQVVLASIASEFVLGFAFWSEYKDRKRVRSTTWPWNIKPSLVVLWGVCWQFIYPPAQVPQTSQLFAQAFDDRGQQKLNSSTAVADQSFRATTPLDFENDPNIYGGNSYTQYMQAISGQSQHYNRFTNNQHQSQATNWADLSALGSLGRNLSYADSTVDVSRNESLYPPPSTDYTLPAASSARAADYASFGTSPSGAFGCQESTYSTPTLHAAAPTVNSTQDAFSFSKNQKISLNQFNDQYSNFSTNLQLDIPHTPYQHHPVLMLQTPNGSQQNPSYAYSPRLSHHSTETDHEDDRTEVLEPSNYTGQAFANMPHQTTDFPVETPSTASVGSVLSPDQPTRQSSPPINDSGRYYCTECEGETFGRKCEYRKHMDRHTRPHKCTDPACDKLKGFTYSGGLARHQREVHNIGGGPKEVLFCPHKNCKRSKQSSSLNAKGFTRRENLAEHERRCHTSEVGEADPKNDEDYPILESGPTVRRRKRSTGTDDLEDQAESLRDQVKRMRHNEDKKNEEMVTMQKELAFVKAMMMEMKGQRG
ncbi:MAG: hypothetical protein M1814_002682 [Vezdaea aestivalis]|nr:MAG: hypothetical protein M1814_002682 [Vezdaea aestivalis]